MRLLLGFVFVLGGCVGPERALCERGNGGEYSERSAHQQIACRLGVSIAAGQKKELDAQIRLKTSRRQCEEIYGPKSALEAPAPGSEKGAHVAACFAAAERAAPGDGETDTDPQALLEIKLLWVGECAKACRMGACRFLLGSEAQCE